MDAIKSNLCLFVVADRLLMETNLKLTTLTSAVVDNNMNEIENIIRKISAQTLVDSLETRNLYFGLHLEDIRSINSDMLKSIFEQHRLELRSARESVASTISPFEMQQHVNASPEYFRSNATWEAGKFLTDKFRALMNIEDRFKYYKWLMIGECCFENKEYNFAAEAYNCAAREGRVFRRNHFYYEAELHYKIAVCYFNLSIYDKSLEMLKKSSKFIELKSATLNDSYGYGASFSQTESDTLRIFNETVNNKMTEAELKLISFNGIS